MVMETNKLRESAANLVKSYPNDQEPCLTSQMVHLQAFLQTMDAVIVVKWTNGQL